MIPRLLQFASIAASLLAWSWQFDYDEGINLNATLQLAQGRNIYRTNGPDGFISAPYTPLLYLLNAPVSWLTGAALWPGRLISLLSTLAIAALLVYIVRRASMLWGAGVLAGMLWLSLSPVMVWSTLYKQDMPALALGLGGLAWIIRNPQGRAYPAILFALAFYTKQSALAPAAAATLWLLLREWRAGLKFGGVLAALIVVPTLLANLLLKGGLWEHLVGNNSFAWTLERFNRSLRPLLNEYWPLLIWAGVSLLFALAQISSFKSRNLNLKSQITGPYALFVLYFLIGTLSTMTQMGYEGGNYNHLLDGLLSLCLLTGVSVAWLWKERRTSANFKIESPHSSSHIPYAGLVAFGVLFGLQFFAYNDPRNWYRGGWWPDPALSANMENLSRLVAAAQGDVYSEYASLLLANGKPVLYDDASTFVPLAKAGRWDESIFVQSLRNRRFSLVLLQQGSNRLTPAMRKAFEENYLLKFPSLLDTYEARLDPPVPQYALDCALSGDGDIVTLKGYALAPGVSYNGVKSGEVLRATLYWQPNQKLRRQYASYLHLVDATGKPVAARDNPQTGAGAPTTAWEPSKVITDSTTLPIPASLSPGEYRLITGMYSTESGGITPLTSTCTRGEQRFGDGVLLGVVAVKKGNLIP